MTAARCGLKFGGLRDLIIGMTVVLADGTIAKTGGKVVKNVAGYDLHKLMTGSFGTLGVIAEVNFRLHPVEEHVRTWTVTAPEAALPTLCGAAAHPDGLADDAVVRAAPRGTANAPSISASRPSPSALTNMGSRITKSLRKSDID